MTGNEEEMNGIVARLNDFEARYIQAHSAHVRHPTPEHWQALQDVGDTYENAIQACWDKGMIPIWHKTEGTYKIE